MQPMWGCVGPLRVLLFFSCTRAQHDDWLIHLLAVSISLGQTHQAELVMVRSQATRLAARTAHSR